MAIYITVYQLFFIFCYIFAEEGGKKNGCNNIWLGESAAFSFLNNTEERRKVTTSSPSLFHVKKKKKEKYL
jgi:hypothetical protein